MDNLPKKMVPKAIKLLNYACKQVPSTVSDDRNTIIQHGWFALGQQSVRLNRYEPFTKALPYYRMTTSDWELWLTVGKGDDPAKWPLKTIVKAEYTGELSAIERELIFVSLLS